MSITVDDISSPVASAGLTLTLGWVSVVLVAHLMTGLPGVLGTMADRVAQSLTPRFLRSALTAVIGLGLGASPAVAADEPLPVLDRVSTAQLTASGPVPAPGPVAAEHVESGAESATDGSPSDPTPDPPPPQDPIESVDAAGSGSQAPSAPHYVVKRGDTLWGIASAHLPRTATAADIDSSWRQWWQSNRAVIGADPNLIRPGQQLTQPESKFPE